MAVEITVQNSDEFQEMVDSKDFRISEAVVSGILKNINTKKRHVHVLSIACIEDDAIYDITVERKHFAETLEENLPYYIKEERYEDCRVIADTIDKLKNQEIGNLIEDISKSKK
jgi:protein-arginine kinase activator protein McsA